MKYENLGSLVYRPERNMVYYKNPRVLRVFEKYGKSALKRALETVVSRLSSIDDSDIHLEGCIVTSNILRRYIEDRIGFMNIMIYPAQGYVRYRLNRTGKFVTNLHQQRSPIIITNLSLFLKNNGSSFIWIPGVGNELKNEIDGVLLFRQNPFEFPPKHFQEVIDYDQFEEKKK
jgi:hypothetical protein